MVLRLWDFEVEDNTDACVDRVLSALSEAREKGLTPASAHQDR